MSFRLLAPLLLLAVAHVASATTYCCQSDGRRVCGDILPQECLNRAYQEIGRYGNVVKQHEAPLTPEQRAVREVELARKQAEERRIAEEERGRRALLASYSSVKDIDAKRERMVADAENQLKATQVRYDNAVARRDELARELEFYAKKQPPEDLAASVRDNEAEIMALQAAVELRRKDIADVAARYDEEKKRYLDALAKRAAGMR